MDRGDRHRIPSPCVQLPMPERREIANSTLAQTRGLDRITVKKRCGIRMRSPGRAPGLIEIEDRKSKVDNSRAVLDSRSSILDYRAPTRTRIPSRLRRDEDPAGGGTWNPLIKSRTRSRHCELGQTASPVAVESGADKSKSVTSKAASVLSA